MILDMRRLLFLLLLLLLVVLFFMSLSLLVLFKATYFSKWMDRILAVSYV